MSPIVLVLAAAAFAGEEIRGGEIPPMDAELGGPSPGSTSFAHVHESTVAPGAFASVVAGYAHRPVTYTDWQGDSWDVVGSLATTDLVAGVGAGRLQVAAHAPVYVRSWGGSAPETTGLGDVRVHVRGALLERGRGLGLSLAAQAGLPTATLDAAVGSGTVSGGGRVIVDGEAGPVLLAVNIGVDAVPQVDLENLSWGPRLAGGLGAAWSLSDATGLSAELVASAPLASLDVPEARPAEGTVGGWVRIGQERAWVVHPSVGVGLTHGVGAPAARGQLSIGWIPRPAAMVAAVTPPPPLPEPVVSTPQPQPEPQPEPEVAPEPAVAPTLIPAVARFAVAEARVRPEDEASLAAIADQLLAHSDLRLVIEGHADSRGEASFNDTLSLARAQAVADWLVALGIAPERLEVAGYGESRPAVSPELTEADADANRRVTFTVAP